MTARIERVGLPEAAHLRRALGERADGLCPGARVIDADIQGPTGIDLILADGEGRPVFVDVVTGDLRAVPARIFEHRQWFEDNRRLFLKAYSGDGIVRVEDPVFAFVAGRFPKSVMDAVATMRDVTVRLIRAEYFLIDGAGELLLEDVTPEPPERISAPVARRAQEMKGGAGKPSDIIQTDAVRTLLALFRSGVDGLDGRIRAVESDDVISFAVGDRPLARVAVSPGSFTVSPGDGVSNPIVVSDRVSLERALNSVVSLFVRDEAPRSGGNGDDAREALDEEERAELAGIWGVGLGAGEHS